MKARHASNLKSAFGLGKKAMLLALAIFLFTATSVGALYFDIQGQVDSQEVDSMLKNRPERSSTNDSPPRHMSADPFAGQAVNLAIIGSDTRADQEGSFGDAQGMRSDVALLTHISADRNRVDIVSIPRDSWVQVPSCVRSDGTRTPPMVGKFNSAFALGGMHGDTASAAACTITLIESSTGIYVDGYAVVDFNGFEAVVDSLGGVRMDVEDPIVSPKAHLELEAGEQVLDGEQALGYARARSGVGLDGSDIARISRQQELFTAIISQALEDITDIQQTYDFTSSVASTITASPNVGRINNAAGLAWSLRDLETDNLNFITVPIVDRGDGANVLWTQSADLLWERLRNDEPPIEFLESESLDSEQNALPVEPMRSGQELRPE